MEQSPVSSGQGCCLPNEIWSIIVDYALRMPHQFRWELWQRYRPVNRLFKEVTEDYYIEKYLKNTHLDIDCPNYFNIGPDVPELTENYCFDGWVDDTKQMAILRSSLTCGDRGSTAQSLTIADLIDDQLSAFTERGYHPCMAMIVGDGATDMLPMDLSCQSTASDRYFVFNWREYFCTLFEELRRVDIYHSVLRRCPNLVQLAWKLDHQAPEEGDELATEYDVVFGGDEVEVLQKLVGAAQTPLVGQDGRLLDFRRMRRRRLGIKSGQVEDATCGPSSILLDRFERLDEELVAQKLHLISLDFSDGSSRGLQW
ncbi:hypothetical protein P168DRAFT_320348 [Aspergillus campestris IBT 28561]|uniref:Uncharacterized protein n=1 Tax=Aspergillus campestris (strain IBT 28561) TaxID=1392248 RepID=A0A2I1CYV2_ASPC2|nr:uncharacterized protein P168DRAFT_320348 [Aspergillus campestris IBT 28561]PKY02809.1 hypothetical protein P168DRAFT_320348 [Aspergillus campestris IBT 28561]